MKNRILSTGHNPLYAQDGLPTKKHLNYYKNKAKGGLGLIISESISVHPNQRIWIQGGQILGFLDEFVSGMREVTAAVHEYDARIFVQLMIGLSSDPSIGRENRLGIGTLTPAPGCRNG